MTMDYQKWMLVMQKGISIVFILSLALRPGSSLKGCQHIMDLFYQLELCHAHLDEPKEMALQGKLTSQKRDDVCRIYQDSTRCIQNIVSDCELEDSVHLEQAEVFLEDHIKGFGKLCDDSDFFNRYQDYASCYRDSFDQTDQCVSNFKAAVESSHYAEEYYDGDDYYQGDGKQGDEYSAEYPPMCRAVDELYACVKRSVRGVCDEPAANLYVQLCHFEVPRDMVAHCRHQEVMSDQFKAQSKASLVLTHFCILFGSLIFGFI